MTLKITKEEARELLNAIDYYCADCPTCYEILEDVREELCKTIK